MKLVLFVTLIPLTLSTLLLVVLDLAPVWWVCCYTAAGYIATCALPLNISRREGFL